MDLASTLELVLAIAIGIATLIGLVYYFQFIRPRTNAFKLGQSRAAIWFNQGELVLWNPGQTFAFLQNKKLLHVGDVNGGMKTIYPYRGQEAVGPIPLQSALFTWEDGGVLTRDGQPLSIKIGVWWKVDDAEKYVFHIYSDPGAAFVGGNGSSIAPPPRIGDRAYGNPVMAGRAALGTSTNARFDTMAMHRVADQWLRVITESRVRAKINSLAVSEVVSAQAMQFLKYSGEERTDSVTAAGIFESALLDVQGEIQRKALEFGLFVERLEVQHVKLPAIIQDAINETRAAFLTPIREEREAEAARIKLEKLVSVLGKETVGLNEVMKNLKNASFVTPMNFLQPFTDPIAKKAAALSEKEREPESKQLEN